MIDLIGLFSRFYLAELGWPKIHKLTQHVRVHQKLGVPPQFLKT